jgi:riboflavin biosynthesis pyrimidine reductase
MNLKICYNASEDRFSLPPQIKECYGPFGFPDHAGTHRPYITSNLVMGLDGGASYRELKGRAGGSVVSKSAEDRWLMDFLRAHHDAQLMDASTLREEGDAGRQGVDFGIDDQELQVYRQKTLGLGKQRIIVLTGSGKIDLGARLFHSPRVEPWILTNSHGEKELQLQLKAPGWKGNVKIISIGNSGRIDLSAAVQFLWREHGIRTLLCEGGPNLYGELLKKRLIDEDFRTLSLQVLGASTKPGIVRPTAYGDVSYSPETAPWFRLISFHYALPYHVFLRLRYEGPRKRARR